MEDQPEVRTFSRRGFLASGATGVVGLAAGRLINEAAPLLKQEERERHRFIQTLRDFKTEDLTNPDSIKFWDFVKTSSREYARVVGIENPDVADWLVKRTYAHTTPAKFVEEVKKSGVPDYSDQASWGNAALAVKRVNLNLEIIKRDSLERSNYPGILLYSVLVHEWEHILAKERTQARFLHSPNEVLTFEDRPPQQWEKYRGGEIITKNGWGLDRFDKTWVEYISERVLMTSLNGEADLCLSASHLFAYNRYSEKVQRLSRFAGQINIKELAKMHRESDLEEFLVKIGSSFKESVLTTVSGVYRNNRNDEEMKEQKDFLAGKRLAFAINLEERDIYRQLLTHLK